MAKQNYGGVYALMDFPPYVFREFPKLIHTGAHGQYEIVQNKKEEDEVLGRLKAAADALPPENTVSLATFDPIRETLISRARELEVPINRKWSLAKIRAAIQEAEEAIDNLPAEDNLPPEDEQTAIDEAHAETDEDDKDSLIDKAKSLGIPASKLWGIPRLKKYIAEAEAKLNK